MRKYLEINRDNLLAFVPLLEKHLGEIADCYKIPLDVIEEVHRLASIPKSSQKHWEQYAHLYQRLGAKFYLVKEEVDRLLNNTVYVKYRRLPVSAFKHLASGCPSVTFFMPFLNQA